MSDQCFHNRLCSCRLNVSDIIDDVQNKIEGCIQKYMSFEETVTYLQDNHNIRHHLTKLIWERLQKENPDFFKLYDLKRELACHIKMFNGLLGMQASLMIDHGHIDLSTASPAIMTFLCEDPQGIRLLEKLANTPSDRSEVSPSSLAMADTNGPTVNQFQISNDQQNQFHYNQWSTMPNDFACNDLGAHPIAPAPTDQWFTSSDIAFNNLQIPNGQPNQLHQNQTPTVAQTPTVPDDLLTFYFGDNIE